MLVLLNLDLLLKRLMILLFNTDLTASASRSFFSIAICAARVLMPLRISTIAVSQDYPNKLRYLAARIQVEGGAHLCAELPLEQLLANSSPEWALGIHHPFNCHRNPQTLGSLNSLR